MPIGNVSKKRGKAKVNLLSKREAATQNLMGCYGEDYDAKVIEIY